MEFGDAALRLAGFCGVVLGWSPDQFWSATPAEVAAVVAALSPPETRGVDGAELARLRQALGEALDG